VVRRDEALDERGHWTRDRSPQCLCALRTHSADLALHRAHNAAETADQRAAITDWLYLLHQYDLLTEAQADVTARA